MNRKNLGLGIFSILFGIFLFIISLSIRDFAAVGVGAKFFPRIASLGFIILGLIFIAEQVRIRILTNVQNDSTEKTQISFTINPAVFSMLLLVVYVAAISFLGYIISSIIYIYFQILILNRGKTIHHLRFVMIAVVSSALSYFLFVRVFGVMIPAGLLG
ncbi:tripartite tricarboxylate transporter TctB family protein [uncultured Sphaerochaeta sp.]|uniref:tripartite tricarboxylate transporter TctB family protein n=1 Tax=uncultured Sphaerochaeta sp. TaxID=886478 RepID=UPI002AA8CAE1|nr:tripartite tricarboxylate transporter TctB family protein [uncultured Sphaerochaeta sp.]